MSLTLTGVSFRYSPTSPWIIESYSTQIESGESVAVMGPSGIGKSTFLALAGLLLAPETGQVLLDGTPRAPHDRARLVRQGCLAWVQQRVMLLPSRSVLDNVLLPLLVADRSRREAEEPALHALEAVGLTDLAQRDVRSLSGGQQQRVAIARSVVTKPSLLLADEPTSGLDPETAAHVMDSLLGAVGQTSLVVATHDPSVASRCDRTINFEDLHEAA